MITFQILSAFLMTNPISSLVCMTNGRERNEISTLHSSHPGHSQLGQPGRSRHFKQWQSTGAIDVATLESMNAPDCEWIGRGPALQTVGNNLHCRAKTDGITQTPLLPHPSIGTVWISYTSISYVMNTNMPKLRLTAKLWHSSLEKKESRS